MKKNAWKQINDTYFIIRSPQWTFKEYINRAWSNYCRDRQWQFDGRIESTYRRLRLMMKRVRDLFRPAQIASCNSCSHAFFRNDTASGVFAKWQVQSRLLRCSRPSIGSRILRIAERAWIEGSSFEIDSITLSEGRATKMAWSFRNESHSQWNNHRCSSLSRTPNKNK